MDKNQSGKSNQKSDSVSKQKPTASATGKVSNFTNPTASKVKQKNSKEEAPTRDQGKVQGTANHKNGISDEENY